MAPPDTSSSVARDSAETSVEESCALVPGFGPLLQTAVTELSGVGPERAKLLERLGIHTVGDLLHHRPRTYEDRRAYHPIAELSAGQFAVVQGSITECGTRRSRIGGPYTFEFILEDDSGRLHCRWWNTSYVERLVRVGDTLVVWGKVRSERPRRMDHPEFERVGRRDIENTPSARVRSRIHLGRLVPVYPLTEGITQRQLRDWVHETMERFAAAIEEPKPEILPALWPSRQESFRHLHFPPDPDAAVRARQRLALDEFVALQWSLQRRRRNLQRRATALPCSGDNRWMGSFLKSLPFEFTEAQRRVLREIRDDLAGAQPMRRLLQGDVGSGKTVVAAAAALMTLESGHDVAVMAPTEVLANQLYATFQAWFQPLAIPVRLHTANQKDPSPPPVPSLTVGTHALLQDSFEPDRLGLVIIDEQHRFGVSQREQLLRKGRYPHLLIQTATPIPRTLGLVLYGDLDVSVLEGLPPGRGTVRTHLRNLAALPRVMAFVRQKIELGQQVYVVCPRILESEEKNELSVLREGKRFQQGLYPHAVGVLHGRLSPLEKQSVMDAFRQGTTRILVATTVIEVGVDVPKATIMIIQNAEQFGLAQLHQLRGRIGRGQEDSHCILISDTDNPTSQERLSILTQTQDGFALAEADLRLRGAGDLIGQDQSGIPPFRFADLVEDSDLLDSARAWVAAYLARQPFGSGESEG